MNIDKNGFRVVQIGANRGNDELSEYIFNNYNHIKFGLFVEANSLHIEELKKCYQNYENIFVENVAVKTPLQEENIITIYYHTADTPNFGISSCNIEHIKTHINWPGSRLTSGEIKSFEVSCITIDKLFEKYSIHELDLLYLDIEGLDAEILLTLDWKKYKIKKVEFEFIHTGYYKDALKNMMIGMGYVQVNSLHEFNWAFEKFV